MHGEPIRCSLSRDTPPSELENEPTLTGLESPWAIESRRGSANVPALVIAWSAAEPHRVGEIAFLPGKGGERVLGRGPELDDDPAPRLLFAPQRPGHFGAEREILGPQISRRQLILQLRRGEIRCERIGSCPMTINGELTDSGALRAGDTLSLKDQLVLICVRRPRKMPEASSYPDHSTVAFGGADRFGMVGESSLAWKLRNDIAFLAHAAGHVLVVGESGVGKEVAAHAIHGHSPRGQRKIVARSAATIPDTLIDAELFGNVGNYPNPGMRDRPGLIGEADGSSLFLDEIGELPQPLQARLLRVLDSGGEYSRLGEARSRRADFRLIAATNRGTEELKHDFAARFTLQLEIPGLNARREDIPLLIRFLLARAADGNTDVARRYFDADDTSFERPRVAPDLVAYLSRHRYSLHTRELDSLLWKAMLSSPESFIGLTPEVEEESRRAVAQTPVEPQQLTKDAVNDSLERHGGNVTRAAQDLGLKNRYVLYRLMRKLGVGS